MKTTYTFDPDLEMENFDANIDTYLRIEAEMETAHEMWNAQNVIRQYTHQS